MPSILKLIIVPSLWYRKLFVCLSAQANSYFKNPSFDVFKNRKEKRRDLICGMFGEGTQSPKKKRFECKMHGLVIEILLSNIHTYTRCLKTEVQRCVRNVGSKPNDLSSYVCVVCLLTINYNI